MNYQIASNIYNILADLNYLQLVTSIKTNNSTIASLINDTLKARKSKV